VEILEREVTVSSIRWMKVCARDTGGVMSSGGGERATSVVVSNHLRDVMDSSSTVADAYAMLLVGSGGSVRDGMEDRGRCGDIREGGGSIHDPMDEGMRKRHRWIDVFWW